MSESDILPAPVLDVAPLPKDKWERERLAFEQQLPQLLENYRGKYVAAHEGQVADSDDELVPLAFRLYRRHGYVPIFMDLVAEHPLPSLRIPHYRILNET